MILELRLMTDVTVLNGVVWLGQRASAFSGRCLKPDIVNIITLSVPHHTEIHQHNAKCSSPLTYVLCITHIDSCSNLQGVSQLIMIQDKTVFTDSRDVNRQTAVQHLFHLCRTNKCNVSLSETWSAMPLTFSVFPGA